MAKKVLSVRVDEEILKRMETFCEQSEKSQAEFIAEAIQAYLAYLTIRKTGGEVVAVKNPQLIEHTEEQARKAMEILSETAVQLTRNHPGIDFSVHYLADYAAIRLFKDNEDQKEAFRQFESLRNQE